MKKFRENPQSSRPGRLFAGFSPSARAAALLALPYILVDAVHYFTAGTALVFSMPVVISLYILCGSFAARFARADGIPEGEWPAFGRNAGAMLWLSSTVLNSTVAILVGAASFGWTLFLGIPFLLLCGPILAVGSAIGAYFGAVLYRTFQRRIQA